MLALPTETAIEMKGGALEILKRLQVIPRHKDFVYIQFKSCVHWNSKFVKTYGKSSKTTIVSESILNKSAKF